MKDQPHVIPPEVARDLRLIRGGEPTDGQGLPDPAATSPRPRRRRRRRLLSLLLLLAAGSAGGGYLWQQRALAPPEVSLVAVGMREFGMPRVTLRVTGYLAARRQITVSSMAQGKIITMPVTENDEVEEGALLARLENREQKANLNLALARLEQAKADAERIRQLYAKGTVSTAERDHANTALQVAQAQADLAHVIVDQTEIRAPIRGTVIRKLRDVGEFLTIGVTASGDPGTAVATLADLRTMYVDLDVNETEIHKVAIGTVASIAPEALRNRRYLGDVTEVAATANRQKGMVSVKLQLRRPERELKPDMTAIVSFLSAEPSGPIELLPGLPASAVVERDGRKVVFVVDNDTVALADVEGRDGGDGYIALARGPAEGTYVVESPPPTLQAGQKVRVRTP